IKALDDLTRTYPAFIQARATQLVALSLRLDDIKFEIKHLQASSDDLNRKVAELEQKKSPTDWQNRVNALVDRVKTIKRAPVPLVAEASALDKRTNDAFTALKFKPEELQPGDEMHIARAQAIFLGVKGSEKTIEFAEKYRSLGGKDGWDAIALG